MAAEPTTSSLPNLDQTNEDELSGHYSCIRNDVHQLLKSFSSLESVRYKDFAMIWREKHMSLLFSGRQNDVECREFTEKVLQVTLSFWLPPYSFQVRVGGLYALYGFYYTQPFEPRAQIRVTMSQWKEIQDFQSEARNEQHLDTDFIFSKLVFANAFQFVAAAKEHYISSAIAKKKQEACKEAYLLEITEKKSSVHEIFENDGIDQISAIHDQYHSLKCKLNQSSTPSAGLHIIVPSLVQDITKSLAALDDAKKNRLNRKILRKRRESGATTSESESESDILKNSYEASSPGSKRASIKDRAYSEISQTRRSRRHRKNKTEASTILPPKRTLQKVTSDFAVDDSDDDGDASSDFVKVVLSDPTASNDGSEILHMPVLVEEPAAVEEKSTKGKQKRKNSPNKSKKKRN
ncbi:hypothetical protein CAPTEDRAFT_203916 [Capitella teleta]|uniref:snRNA-activating protein complex subunit 1 n=1 Tax=Capitella teleta TaxID=283909 RepID=R7VII2_CAPTE|nr:hypothetical protein CAPTEDRAFT_203916 [Capitella teleta]|eukprot:ELU16101.1 hypothetical protein CAPTEDRAFT_203916 [Capitella teleta]